MGGQQLRPDHRSAANHRPLLRCEPFDLLSSSFDASPGLSVSHARPVDDDVHRLPELQRRGNDRIAGIVPQCASRRLYSHLGKVRKMGLRCITPQSALFLSCIVMQFLNLPNTVYSGNDRTQVVSLSSRATSSLMSLVIRCLSTYTWSTDIPNVLATFATSHPLFT